MSAFPISLENKPSNSTKNSTKTSKARLYSVAILIYLLKHYYKLDKVEALQIRLNEKYHASLAPDGLLGKLTYHWLYKDLLHPEPVTFSGYDAMIHPKKQIVLHHGANWDNARNMFAIWQQEKRMVATAVGIQDDGSLVRGFDEHYWAHHLGMRNAQNLLRNQQSVAIEICNWGALMERGGQFYAWPHNYGRHGESIVVPKEKVVKLSYRGWEYYERYTEAEMATLKKWILLNALRWNIPLHYSEKEVFPAAGQVSQKAIQGEPGIYSHNSYIGWKTDIAPHDNVIQLLTELSAITDHTKMDTSMDTSKDTSKATASKKKV